MFVIVLVLGWVSWQNHQYSDRIDQVLVRLSRESVRQPTGLKEKQAVVDKHPPGIVLAIRIPRVILEVIYLPGSRSQLKAMRGVKVPILWRSRHASLVEFEKLELAKFEIEHERLVYADEYLGDAPSLQQIAALPKDLRYRELSQEIQTATKKVEAAANSLENADPLIASKLPWSPDDLDLREDWSTSRLLDEPVSKAAACARAEIAGKEKPRCAQTLRYVKQTPAS